MEILKQQILQFIEDRLMFSQGDFHANLFQLPEKEKEQQITATSGRKCLEQFMRFNRYGSWAKTFLELLIGQGDWYSSKCRLIWKMKGTKFFRLYFQLAASTHRTKGKEFGLLPTPTVSEIEGAPITNVEMKNGSFSRTNKKGERWGVKLKDVIVSGLLPTPRVTTNNMTGCVRKNTKSRLEDVIATQAGKTSQLNPRFVSEMMGFPPDWTELPFQNGETNQSKPTEMQ